jgi:hypothetical protein
MKYAMLSTVMVSVNLISLPATAQTYFDACPTTSYIVLPGGQCVGLEYLGILGESRANRAQAEQTYEELFDLNVDIEVFHNQYPQYNTETEEERDARITHLAETGMMRDEVVASSEAVEDILYPVHRQTVEIMWGAFVEHLYDQPSLSP